MPSGMHLFSCLICLSLQNAGRHSTCVFNMESVEELVIYDIIVHFMYSVGWILINIGSTQKMLCLHL